MEPVSLSFDCRLEDWRALQTAERRRVNRAGTRLQLAVTRLPGAIFIALLFAGAGLVNDSKLLIAGAVCVVGVLLFVMAQSALVVRRYRPRPDGMFLGAMRVTLDAEGLHFSRPGVEMLVRWSRVLGVDATAMHTFVWVDSVQGYALPARALPAPLTATALAECIRAFMTAAGVAPDPTPRWKDDVRISPSAAGDILTDAPLPQPGVWRELAAIDCIRQRIVFVGGKQCSARR